ncbi:macrolide family glycosyltransferase [Clostridium beijerinckii]|jgi:MGT family glycosyltransferase|uniref:Glycosyl transferase n=2 Tax=Clostridium beijerinckii TaxID=1520 RepID=A0AAE2UZY5_CLOBE|nr:macrolide family glycosyltransferase [Clostridium beijerinckii]ABR33901.1 glycosyltransferase, MGT family [Clostridium beijerinckii NCIMB 8052]AIU04322.1 glycosyl transferase family protein [Clostridium beijerinckii ATCC 35702]MBF7811495.1 glycosyl transferase [Clostridium beijerinckii]NOW92249.1 MGT family glycosyltransferase [Clostridium beijerinckii]NRT24807.1 MGT family glycosyltransferase [Clostridium beijerinckii]
MSKALFVNMLGHGHVNPTIGIVRELINRGEDVTYIAGEEFRDKIEKTGAKFIGHKNLFDLSSLITSSLNLETNEKLLNALNTFKEIIEEIFKLDEKFDYIIYDSSFVLGGEVGRVLNIPTISSSSIFAINEKIIKSLLDLPISQEFKLKMEGAKPKIKEILSSHNYVDFVNELQEKYNIKFPSMVDRSGKKAMLNIVYTSKYFQPYSESFDESYKFIGSSVIDRKESIDFDLSNDEDKKVIYISLGTIFNNSIEFYECCFKAFCNMNVKVIMSVGRKIDISMFKNIPSNFIVRNYVPQLEVLKYADVFITHGGMNSTNEGLYFNIPLILIPQSVDQPFVANRVAELGAGIVIEKNRITPEALNKCVAEILSDDNFRLNSEKIGESLREAGGYKVGVDEIIKLKDSMK